MSAEDVAFFLSHVPAGSGMSAWEWPRGRIAEAAGAMPASGPDGLPYAFWSAAGGDTWTTSLSALLTDKGCLLRSSSHTVWMPKGEFTEDMVRVTRKFNHLGPTTLIHTSGTIVAMSTNDAVSCKGRPRE